MLPSPAIKMIVDSATTITASAVSSGANAKVIADIYKAIFDAAREKLEEVMDDEKRS